jgi:hypothetical protein
MIVRRTSLSLGPAALAAALLMMLPSRVPAQEVVNLRATLRPSRTDPQASGVASYERAGRHQHLNVEVQGIASSNPVDIFVNDCFVATLDLVRGYGTLDLDTDVGDDVPLINEGDVLSVFDANDERVILLGTFYRVRRSDG